MSACLEGDIFYLPMNILNAHVVHNIKMIFCHVASGG